MAQQRLNPWRPALAVAVCGAGLLWFVSARGAEPNRGRPAPTPEAAPSARDLQRVQTELERLRADLARAERRIAELELAMSEVTAAPTLATALTTVPDTPAALSEPTDQDQRQHVARAFEAEADDPSWKPDAEIQSVLKATLPAGSSLRSVVCRSSLCRVETSHADQSSQQAFAGALAMPHFGAPRPFKAALFDPGQLSADGRELRAVTYLVRPGRAFPDP